MVTASATSPSYSRPGALMKDNFPDLLNVQFREIKRRELSGPVQGLKFFTVRNTSRDYEKHNYVTGMGLAQKSRDVDRMPYAYILQGFDNTYTPDDFRLAVRVEKRLRETDQFGVISSLMSSLMQAGRDTVEYWAADAFNTGFTSAAKWVCADGMYLFDSGRPQEDAGQTSWSNLETGGAPTQAAIATMRVNFRKNVNSRGLVRPITMKTIICPPALEDTVVVNSNSSLKPGTSLNDDNYNKRHGFTIDVWDYLSSDTQWFGMGAKDMRHELFWYWRVKPETLTYLAGDNPDVTVHRLRMSYITGADRPCNLRGNVGA